MCIRSSAPSHLPYFHHLQRPLDKLGKIPAPSSASYFSTIAQFPHLYNGSIILPIIVYLISGHILCDFFLSCLHI